MEQSDFESTLSPVLERVRPGFRELRKADRLTGGASQETWRLRLETESGEETLCLRRSSGAVGGVEGSSLSPAAEAGLMMAAAAAGVPEPEVVHVLEPADGLGEGFLMTWLTGETLGGRIANSSRFEALRPALSRQCGHILGRIHSVDPASLHAGLEHYTPAQLVEATWQQYRDFHTPQPMLDFAARWLLENLPPEVPPALVHGDFRNGNLMVSEEAGIVGVLDWELAAIGDPIRDLGWLCVNSWRFGQAEFPVGGFGLVSDLLEAYRETTGRDVAPAHLNFWIVFGSFWWSVCCLRMADSYRSGENRSVERPAIGRRASEGQADLVAMLIPGALKDLPGAAGSQGDLPSLPELLQSTADFLAAEVAPELAGARGYLVRVAANSIGIVRRQVELGPALDAAEHTRLEQLLSRQGSLQTMRWVLVEALRGDMSLETPGLAEHLRLTVRGQLAIDQPGYKVTPGLPG